MSLRGLTGAILLLAGMVAAADAGAAELKVLSVDAMKPALQELAPAFESSAKDKLKVDYATAADVEKKINDEDAYDVVILDQATAKKLEGAAKIPGGLVKPLAKQGADKVYVAGTTNWTDQPLAAKALIDFLAAPKAAEVYKAKGLQPG